MIFVQRNAHIILRFIKIFSFVILITLVQNLSARQPTKSKEFGYKGFTGGMFFHSGYVTSKSFVINNLDGTPLDTRKASGGPYGLGGAAKIHISNHIRVGGMGYVSYLNYDKHGSHASIGWGGALVDFFHQFKKCTPFFGVCIGGGSEKNTVLQTGYKNDYIAQPGSYYHKYAFCAVDPYIGIEIALTQKVHLVFMADYLLNVSRPEPDFVQGPRFFVGIMFSRLKE